MNQPPQHQNPPPGWYPDQQGNRRWWDGRQWAPPPAAAPQPGQQQPTPNQQPHQPAPRFNQAAHNAGPSAPYSGQTAPGQTAPGQSASPRKPGRTGLVTGIAAAAILLLAGGVVGVTMLLGNNQGNDDTDANGAPTASASTEVDDPTGAGDPGNGPQTITEERDQFFKDQKIELNNTIHEAATPEQEAFIEDIRSKREAAGDTTWSPEIETVTIALASDACETSILNSHNVDTEIVRIHAATSPLIKQMVKGKTESERIRMTQGAMEIATTGVGYMCPADEPDWTAAMKEINGDW
ncbi:hypothetical protein [Gulosibacter bifidus]|uniref:DUF2510 domain-containing protein n=1 Tax=Gulosibacter bifidus TaxID=272239 RepID=A0ABW5RL98_9MICO|nr:hypothetical protein [Gulosibacter bifidus]